MERDIYKEDKVRHGDTDVRIQSRVMRTRCRMNAIKATEEQILYNPSNE